MRIRLSPTALTASRVLALSMALAPIGAGAQEPVDLATATRIRQAGLERSEALSLYHTLTDAIGGRLPASPSHNEAAAWARERFAEWGLAEARLEPFEFGRGWSLEKLSLEMTSPRYMPLTGYPEAWTPSIAGGVLSGQVVYLGDKTAAEIQAMAASLRGAIVLTHEPQTQFFDVDRPQPGLSDASVRTGNPQGIPLRSATPMQQVLPLLRAAGVGVTLRPSAYRDGTVGVVGSRTTEDGAVPAIVLAAEQYNMLVRMAQSGVPAELRAELRTRYHPDTRTYNVFAEIPGSDPELRNEVVLIGAHLDSWHTAIGATDNADGVVAVMEAMRILAELGVRPRRTIRAVLWSGEEQGLLARAPTSRSSWPIWPRATGSRSTSTTTPAPAGRSGSTCRTTPRRRRSSTRGSSPSATSTSGGTSSKGSAARITCPSTRSGSRPSPRSRTSRPTTSARATRTPTTPTACRRTS